MSDRPHISAITETLAKENTRLAAENEKLREALRPIAEEGAISAKIIADAREALKTKGA